MRLFNFTKATNLKLSRRELLTVAAAISAAGALPALPSIADDAVYIKFDPSLVGLSEHCGAYTVPTPHVVSWNWTATATMCFVADYDEHEKRIIGVRAVAV